MDGVKYLGVGVSKQKRVSIYLSIYLFIKSAMNNGMTQLDT